MLPRQITYEEEQPAAEDPNFYYQSNYLVDPLKFPFSPYQQQKDYMDVILRALSDGKNAILESPTGTGKTFSMLCSVMTWQKLQTDIEKRPAVIYVART